MTKEKLSKYLAAAGAVGGITGANAQIVYTDVDPDVSIHVIPDSNDVYFIDMNGDATIDFGMMAVGYTSSYGGSVSIIQGVALLDWSSNAWGAATTTVGSSTIQILDRLNSGETVGPGLIWATSLGWAAVEATFGPVGSTTMLSAGQWFGTNDGYAAVRFSSAAGDHYGWIRFDVSANGDTITLKDYAYHALPDSTLTTGQTTTSIDESMANRISILGNVDRVTVNILQLQGTAKFELLDVTGKLVHTEVLENETNDLFVGQPTGVYLARVTYGEIVLTEKLYLR